MVQIDLIIIIGKILWRSQRVYQYIKRYRSATLKKPIWLWPTQVYYCGALPFLSPTFLGVGGWGGCHVTYISKIWGNMHWVLFSARYYDEVLYVFFNPQHLWGSMYFICFIPYKRKHILWKYRQASFCPSFDKREFQLTQFS